jgi:hypothetical protein
MGKLASTAWRVLPVRLHQLCYFVFGHVSAEHRVRTADQLRSRPCPNGRRHGFRVPIQEQAVCQSQNVPSMTRVAAGAFGFLIFSHAFDGPDLYGASSFL